MKNRDLCSAEQEIIAGLIDIETGRFLAFVPSDKPYLMAALAEHHRNCPTCQGVSLVEQLFGQVVSNGQK